MEKLGVHEDDELKKEADITKETTPQCPGCGSGVEEHGSVLKCPSCGTEPFEKKD